MRNDGLRLLLLLGLCTGIAEAQCFQPSFGPYVGRGDDGPLQPLRAIGFPFPFAGATWSHLQASNNGVLYLSHGGASGGTTAGYSDDPSVLAANLCGAGPPCVAPFWKDLDLRAEFGGGVHIDTSQPGRCVVTWCNAVEWGRTAPKTVQCQLLANGEIRFHYPEGTDVDGGAVLVGIGGPGAHVDPGPADFATGPLAVGGLAYQTFGPGGFDLAGRTLVFTPAAGGGYTAAAPECPRAVHEGFGVGCGGSARASFHATFGPAAAAGALAGGGYTMRGSASGYTLEVLQSSFVPPSALATALALGDDGELQVPIGLPFPHPAGVATSLWIGANGTVGLGSLAGLQPNRWTPNAAGLLAAPASGWYLWHDFAPSLPGSGPVRCELRGGRFLVTWDGVRSYGGLSTDPPNAFQFQFDTANGDVHFVCQSLGSRGVTDFVLGYSPAGPSLDPGPVDLGDGLPLALLADLPPLGLVVAPAPVLGALLVFATEHIPASAVLAMQVVGFGLFEPGLDLGAFGAPGCLQSVDLRWATLVPLLRPGSDVYAVVVPNVAALAGLAVGSQSLALAPGANALGVVTSNGVRSVLGVY
jgi:hypothetical protein